MSPRPLFRHRAAASTLFTLLAVLAIAAGSGNPRPLALAAGASLLSLFLFTRPATAGALGVFASPLAIVVDTALLLCALSLTGAPASPFALLVPGFVAIAWSLEGKAAARFSAAASFLGIAALAVLSSGTPLLLGAIAPTLGLAIAGPALLAALETGGRGGEREEEAEAAPPLRQAAPEALPAPRPATAEISPPARAAASAAGSRTPEAEILHDLKSPLSVLRVYADLIAEGTQRGELPKPEHLANLQREIDLAERMVGGGPAGREERKAENGDADLVEILGSLATAYRLSQGGRRRIEFIAERPQLLVAADPVVLQRAFRNVIENAIKYPSDGGEIRIRAGGAGNQAFVVVKDTGVGMTPEERERAFEWAFRGTGAVGTPGKGIGLAVTKQILESNGGKISLTSERGFGSEVMILLPQRRRER
jgi:signal transduction histidine kinase